MAHHCHALGCTVAVPPRLFMCRRHWYMVPAALRQAIWREYVPGQEMRKDPTRAYLAVALEAQLAVARREYGRDFRTVADVLLYLRLRRPAEGVTP